MNGKSGGETPHLEIQIHPSDIQKGVRYHFLTRGQLWAWILGVFGYLALLAFSVVVAPGVVANLLSAQEYREQVTQRAQLGERLSALVERMTELQTESEQLHLRMEKIYLAYGLTSDVSIGQGGFPFAAAPVPDSIFAASIEYGSKLEAGIHEQMRVLETFLNEVQSFEAAHRDQVMSTPSTSPLRGDDFVLTSPFGTRRSPFTKEIDFHAGIDLAATPGTPIYAPADGLVVFSGRYPLRQSVAWWRYGNLVSIRHGDRFVTLFGHCDEVKVRSGKRVRQGDLIATVGNTGWSTSPHLHYEIRRLEEDGNFHPVDPRIYILDHRWGDEERLLVRARRAPDPKEFQPLPRLISR